MKTILQGLKTGFICLFWIGTTLMWIYLLICIYMAAGLIVNVFSDKIINSL